MKKKVLVVDDDPNTVKFLTVALSENGYAALGARDGDEGFRRIEEARPDLVVLDVMMPKRTGFTLFNKMKLQDDLKAIPVIMLTGISAVLDEQDGADAADGGVFDPLKQSVRAGIRKMREEGLARPEMFLDKPIDPEVLVAKVRELIGAP